MCTGDHEHMCNQCLRILCVCVYVVEEKEDQSNELARGLYIPCPDHYKNYCVHGECQFPSMLAQPSCRYTHTHTHAVLLYLWGQGSGKDRANRNYAVLLKYFGGIFGGQGMRGEREGMTCDKGHQSTKDTAIIVYALHLNHQVVPIFWHYLTVNATVFEDVLKIPTKKVR